MTSSLKQFAVLISNFIDYSLMPIIQSKLPDCYRVIEQWKQLKNIINEGEAIQIWKIEKYMSNISVNIKSNGIKQINIESLDKHSINSPSRAYSSLFQGQSWKYPMASQSIAGQQTQTQMMDRKKQTISHVGSQLDATKAKDSKNQQNMKSFQALLGSFRKLCTNFENNHKKLVRDRQSLALS